MLVWEVAPGWLGGLDAEQFRLTVRVLAEPGAATLVNRVRIAYGGPDEDVSNNESTWTTQLPRRTRFVYLPMVLREAR